MKQKDKILHYMQTHGSITQAEAYEFFGCTRLGARVYDLRHDGHSIVKVTETGTNRYGDKTAYARYSLEAKA